MTNLDLYNGMFVRRKNLREYAVIVEKEAIMPGLGIGNVVVFKSVFEQPQTTFVLPVDDFLKNYISYNGEDF